MMSVSLCVDSFHGEVPEPPLQQLLQREPSAKIKIDGYAIFTYNIMHDSTCTCTCMCSERNRSGRYRCAVTVSDKGIETIAEASNPKTAKAAAARAALKKLNNQC